MTEARSVGRAGRGVDVPKRVVSDSSTASVHTYYDIAARQATISGSDDLGNTFNAINFGNGAGPSNRKLDIQAVAGIRISDSMSGTTYLFDYGVC